MLHDLRERAYKSESGEIVVTLGEVQELEREFQRLMQDNHALRFMIKKLKEGYYHLSDGSLIDFKNSVRDAAQAYKERFGAGEGLDWFMNNNSGENK